MIAFLESLARLPGVQFVLLSSHDGVPIAHVSGHSVAPNGPEREEGLAALAASWLNDLTMAVAPLSWDAPRRVCLRAGRGTIVLRRSESACLVVLLGRETSPEDVRLSMDGTLARIERGRQGRAQSGASREAESSPSGAAPEFDPQAGPIPSRPSASEVEEGVRPASHPDNPPGN